MKRHLRLARLVPTPKPPDPVPTPPAIVTIRELMTPSQLKRYLEVKRKRLPGTAS